jgi:F5/8 type C domain/von Willebrand factor type A domain
MKRCLSIVIVVMSFFGFVQAQTYIQLILDASGSMYETLESGDTRIDAAKRVLTDFVGGLPNSGLNMGLRFYGATTGGLDDNACTDSQLIVGMNSIAKDAIFQAIQAVEPSGATPIVYALEQAVADFQTLPADAKRLIILVTDGEESCGGNLDAAVQAVTAQGINLQVIGFGLDAKAEATFSKVGAFENAMDALQLATALETTTQAIVPTVAVTTDRKDIIYLVEGDELSGTVTNSTIPVETSFAALELKPSEISQIEVDSEGNATILMRSGDTLTGKFATTKLGFILDAANAEIEVETVTLKKLVFDVRDIEPLVDSLPGEALTASSYWENDDRASPKNAHFSDIETHSNWQPANNSGMNFTNDWLQVDLGQPVRISAVGTKGRANDQQWVQWTASYKLAVSLDGVTWSFLSEAGSDIIFLGNTDTQTEVRNALAVPVTARYIRFYPITWQQVPNMRVEIYGIQ